MARGSEREGVVGGWGEGEGKHCCTCFQCFHSFGAVAMPNNMLLKNVSSQFKYFFKTKTKKQHNL